MELSDIGTSRPENAMRDSRTVAYAVIASQLHRSLKGARRNTMFDSRVNRRTVIKGSAAAGIAGSLASGQASAQDKVQIRLGTWAAEAEASELQTVIDAVNAE